MRQKHEVLAKVLRAFIVIFVVVGFPLEGLTSELFISFYCLCVFHLLDSHLDFSFINYLAINVVERASRMYLLGDANEKLEAPTDANRILGSQFLGFDPHIGARGGSYIGAPSGHTSSRKSKSRKIVR